MIAALTQLLVFQLLGEVIARWLSLPVPGPVLGMLFLFLALLLRGGPDHELQGTSQNLLQHLSLLFVPAGVGIMVHLSRVADEWLPLLLSLLISTALTLAVTALVMKMLMPVRSPADETPGDAP
jgi:holin-like protein